MLMIFLPMYGSDDKIEEDFFTLICEEYGEVTRKTGDFTFLSIFIQQSKDGTKSMTMTGYCHNMLKKLKMSDIV